MKKTMKKSLSLALVFMLLFSVLSMQASALQAFESIAKADFVIEPLSEKMIKQEIEWIEEDYDESEPEYEDYNIFIQLNGEIELSNGEKIEVKDSTGVNKNGKRKIYVEGYYNARDYLDAVKNAKKTVPVRYTVSLYSSIDILLDTYEGEAEAAFVDCYVKNLKVISGFPKEYHETTILSSAFGGSKEEFTLEGVKFAIEYSDSRTVQATVEKVEGERYDTYILDGKEVFWNVDSEEATDVCTVEVYFEDYILPVTVKFIPYPYNGLEIDDVAVNEAFEVESITYTVTMADDTTQTVTANIADLDTITVYATEIFVSYPVEGYPVFVVISKYFGEEYPVKEYIKVSAFTGLYDIASVEIEGEEQEDTLIARIIFIFRTIFNRILSFIGIFI